MVKFQMKIGNHHLRRSIHIKPKNNIVFGLNGRNNYVKTTTKSCSSCLPPPSNNFDSILQNEQFDLRKQNTIEQREREQREREQREREQRERQQREREQRERQQREREQREREQRTRKYKEWHDRQQQEKEQRQKEQQQREDKNREQREREQREREQRVREQREQHEREERVREQREREQREQREREQREREQREREQREREQREREQREREQREREQREREQREREQREREQKEQKEQKEKELGEVFAESPTSVLTDDFESRVMQSNKHTLLLFYAPWCGWCKRIAPDFIKATQDLQGNSEVELMVVDATQWQISHPKVQIQGFPTVFLFKKDDKANPMEYNGDRSAGDLVKFVNTHTNSANIQLNVQEVSGGGHAPIDITDNFNQLVVDSHEDVIVMFYAPWCGWCKKMLPDYDRLAVHFKDQSSKLKIMKMDATAHQVQHENIKIYGFPLVHYFKGGDKQNPVEYKGNRSFDDLVSYVNTNKTF